MDLCCLDLTQIRFCYESGLLQSVSELLIPAEKYCLRRLHHAGGYRILADIYGGLGSLCTESSRFKEAFEYFSIEWDYIQKAFVHNELQRPSIWEVFGLGRVGNGLHGLHRYVEAQQYYEKALETWGELPGDKRIWVSHLATCLSLQGKPYEAEKVIRPFIKDENDTTNFRFVFLFLPLYLV